MSTFLRMIFGGLETGSIFALATLGIIIIFRTSRATNFAQGSIGMFNAFVAASILASRDIPVWLAAIIGMLTAFLTGVLIDLVIIRRANKVNILGKQIITFGLILVLMGLAPMIFGSIPIRFPRFILTGYFEILGARLTHNAFLTIILGLGIMGVLFYFLQYTKWGLAVRVTASNERTAKLMGVPTTLVTMGAWAVAASLGTLSALMVVPPTLGIVPGSMDNVQVNALMAGVLGGFQTFHGPVIAAYIIAISRNLINYYISSTWGEAILLLLILLFMVVRPNGLIGKKIVKKV